MFWQRCPGLGSAVAKVIGWTERQLSLFNSGQKQKAQMLCYTCVVALEAAIANLHEYSGKKVVWRKIIISTWSERSNDRALSDDSTSRGICMFKGVSDVWRRIGRRLVLSIWWINGVDVPGRWHDIKQRCWNHEIHRRTARINCSTFGIDNKLSGDDEIKTSDE